MRTRNSKAATQSKHVEVLSRFVRRNNTRSTNQQSMSTNESDLERAVDSWSMPRQLVLPSTNQQPLDSSNNVSPETSNLVPETSNNVPPETSLVPETNSSVPPTLVTICTKRKEVSAGSSNVVVQAKKTRGPVTGQKTQKEIQARGGLRYKVTWNEKENEPLVDDLHRLVLAIGTIIRNHVPLTAPTYSQLEADDMEIVIDQLSASYELDLREDDDRLYNWIQSNAASRYTDWKSRCKSKIDTIGPNIMTKEFLHRPEQWTWLCNHLATDEQRKFSARMKDMRASAQKINHTSGPKSFKRRSKEYRASKKAAPFLETFADVYNRNAPDRAEKARRLIEEKVAELRETQSNPDDIELPFETEVELLGKIIEPSPGTVIRGFGKESLREAKTRGPAKGTARTAELVQELNDAKEKIREGNERTTNLEAIVEQQQRQIAQLMLHFGQMSSSGQNSESNMRSTP